MGRSTIMIWPSLRPLLNTILLAVLLPKHCDAFCSDLASARSMCRGGHAFAALSLFHFVESFFPGKRVCAYDCSGPFCPLTLLSYPSSLSMAISSPSISLHPPASPRNIPLHLPSIHHTVPFHPPIMPFFSLHLVFWSLAFISIHPSIQPRLRTPGILGQVLQAQYPRPSTPDPVPQVPQAEPSRPGTPGQVH